MKRFIFILVTLLFVSQINAQDSLFEDAMTAASYAYSHSKKAHGANNRAHTQEYSYKAMEAYEKLEKLAEDCGCNTANEMAYEAKTSAEEALNQDTYERSRFYAKRAKEIGEKILIQITECSAGKDQGYDDIASNEDVNEAASQIALQEQELAKKQRQLEIEQKKLEEQIALQKQKQAEFEAMRLAELKEQSIMKNKAEGALAKLENALQELSIAIDDKTFETKKDYVRAESDLKNESLDDTKYYYATRAQEIAKTAMKQFSSFASND